MQRDNVYLGSEASDKLIEGIAKVTAVVRGSYGPSGGNIIVEELGYPHHRVTNDGKQSIDYIKLVDPVENIGANIMKEAGDKADKDSGEGRKTTMILTEAILKEARAVKGVSKNDLRLSLNECVPLIIASLDEQKRPIEIKDVASVATLSSENPELGKLFQDIYEQIGKDGIVEIDNSGLATSYFEITEGVRLRGAKAFGAYSYTEQGKAVYKDPLILITREKIATVEQIEPIISMALQKGKNELIIYCEDIDLSVASRLAQTHLQGGFKTLLVKSPILWKNWLYEDLAKMTGATIVDSVAGLTFKTFNPTHFGTCDKFIATDSEVRVLGIKDMSAHISVLEQLGQTDDQQKVRASWLNTKVAILKVGAQSESELSYVAKKAKDASAAVHLALKDGVVPGGGKALVNAISSLLQTPGGNVLAMALMNPMEQIYKNVNPDKTAIMVSAKSGVNGFDAKNNCEVDDLFAAGIVDPALVVKNAVKNAVSIASTVMTNHGIIILPKTNETHPSMPSMR